MRNYDENALNAQDVANILHVSRNTVYNLVKRGLLASYMVGRKMRFTLKDVDEYISRSHGMAVGAQTPATSGGSAEPELGQVSGQASTMQGSERLRDMASSDVANALESPWVAHPLVGLRLAGSDILADFVANALGQVKTPIQRVFENGYTGLASMYAGTVDASVVHLFDRKTGRFNVPFVQRLVPGTPLVVFQLAKRQSGLVVRRGNPKKIRTWRDVQRSDVIFANREHGSGERILLDEYLASTGAPPAAFDFSVECRSAAAAVSFVTQGYADCAVGCAHDVADEDGLLFVPLIDEELALAVLKTAETESAIAALRPLLTSAKFKKEAARATGYDLAPCGNILYEV